MSQEIDKTAASISRAKLPEMSKSTRNQAQTADNKSAAKPTAEPQQSSSLRTILSELTAGREYSDDNSFKNFTHLVRSLDKYFSEAETVDRQTGTKELQLGGLRRIDTDLRKLFKGLGIPPQQAKQLSRDIAAAIGNNGVEQIDISLSTSNQTQLESQQTRGTYQASGAGRSGVTVEKNSFQLAVINTKRVDISLNLRSGAFTLSPSTKESTTVTRENTSALASFFPLEEDSTIAAAKPIAELDEMTALVNSDSSLQEISRVVKQSAITQLPVSDSNARRDMATEALFNDNLGRLQQLVSDLGEFSGQRGTIFESLLQVTDLRTERKEETNSLLFTLEAQAPIGLTAIDATGHGTTLYPRPDGSFGKRVETAVKVTT